MGYVFVNQEKLARAKEVLSLLLGQKVAQTSDEQVRADRFGRILGEAKIDIKKEDIAVKFVYEKLGGLVRTEAEQEEHEKKVKDIKAKGKKRIIE